jgi:hypothetical protein
VEVGKAKQQSDLLMNAKGTRWMLFHCDVCTTSTQALGAKLFGSNLMQKRNVLNIYSTPVVAPRTNIYNPFSALGFSNSNSELGTLYLGLYFGNRYALINVQQSRTRWLSFTTNCALQSLQSLFVSTSFLPDAQLQPAQAQGERVLQHDLSQTQVTVN